METAEAKGFFISLFSNQEISLVEDASGHLRCKKNGHDVISVSPDDVQEFITSEGVRSTFVCNNTIPSICSQNYREHLIVRLDRNSYFFPPEKRLLLKFGENNSKSMYAEIGPPSTVFHNYFLKDKEYQQYFLKRISLNHFRISTDSTTYRYMVNEFLGKFYSIKLFNMQASNAEQGLATSNQIIKDILFQVSYLKMIPLAPMAEIPWKTRKRKKPKFKYDEPERNTQFDLPKTTYNQDIVNYYLLGMSSDDPTLSFLAYYQVLEYYFDTLSNQKLYENLRRKIKDPRFKLNDANLDVLVKELWTYRRETNEEKKLRTVLIEYINPDELIKFLKDYEVFIEKKQYSSSREVFGDNFKISSKNDEVIADISRLIKHIRNALVHSSDQYEGIQRHIPFSETTDIVRGEIALMRYLAQKVIIGTSKSNDKN